MRTRRLALLSGALALLACDGSSTAPRAPAADPVLAAEVAAAQTFASMLAVEMGGPGRLPEELRLTDDQKAAIAVLTRQFADATAADRAALEEILRAAKAAHDAGRPAPEIRALLAQARPIRQRLELAHAAYRQAVLALLTPAQRAWLESQQRRCDPRAVPPLTEAQRTQIAALHAQFVQANAADLELVRQVNAEARAAVQAGKSDAEIRAILERARPARERLAAAHQALEAAIAAILTPEQRAARCR